jgi:cytochrome c biogenesis protein CcmG/thiol:disulfide interchange protein DsbE
MNRRYLVFGAIAVVAILGIALGVSPSNETETESGLDVPLTYFDGRQGNLDDFLGTPVVVNFFASWCPPCVAELPDFAQVEMLRGDEVVFIGVNTSELDPDAALALAERSGVRYRLVADTDGSIFRRFGGQAMPTTVFIGADGQVIEKHEGALMARSLMTLIDEHLTS